MYAVPAGVRRGHQIPWNGITGGCEPFYGCWGLSPGP
ncbi:mCG147454 [Mus musculus]|nr:mCG147454 [Mus musculus]